MIGYVTEKEEQELSKIKQDPNGNTLHYLYIIEERKIHKAYINKDKGHNMEKNTLRSIESVGLKTVFGEKEYTIGENAFLTEEEAVEKLAEKLAEEINIFFIEDIPYKFEVGDVVRMKESFKGTENYFEGTGVVAFRGFFNHGGQWDVSVLVGNKVENYRDGMLEKVPDATKEEGEKRLHEFYENFRNRVRLMENNRKDGWDEQ